MISASQIASSLQVREHCISTCEKNNCDKSDMNGRKWSYKVGEKIGYDSFVNDFVKSLLQEDSRIRVHSLGGIKIDNLEEDQVFFYVSKKHIHIPISIPVISHEIAHAVEMANPSRWLLPDWGIPLDKENQDKILGAKLFTAMAREVRVRTIQLHIEPNLKMPKNEWQVDKSCSDYGAATYHILNNYYWYDQTKASLPFGRFRTMKDVGNWVSDLREKTYKAWSQERIRHEWTIRLDCMRNFMETKEKRVNQNAA